MTCSDCPSPISTQNRTGRCRMCALARTNSCPEIRTRKAAANRRKMKDPAYRAKTIRNVIIAGKQARQDPAFVELLRENARRNVILAWTPEARAKWLATRKRAAQLRTAKMLPWCPPEHLEEYRRLRARQGGVRAKETILAKLTPFDRQMQALRAGANLVATPGRPQARYDYTLAGGSPL